MNFQIAVVILSGLVAPECLGQLQRYFPTGFKWGAATAAYQVEGAWNVSDKSESLWDVYTHEHPERISDGSNGDVACDSYHLWERDIEIAKELGLGFYRFSISWPRLLPSGFPDKISDDGRRYYQNLIEGLLDNGIEPLVTLYHWDTPQRLQEMGGWTNPLMSDWFAAYSRVVFSLYGNKVKTWLTINEPVSICSFGYGAKQLAPALGDPYVAKYMCDKNVVMAHAKAYRVYEKEFKWKYHGKISLANQIFWYEALTPADEKVTETFRQFSYGVYCHPIFSLEGGWPAEVEKVVAENSRRQGYPESRLPAYTEEEKIIARGSYDFYGLNYYTSRTVRQVDNTTATASAELLVEVGRRPEWRVANGSTWMYINPSGIRKTMSWIKKNYGNVPIFITENGYSDGVQRLEDEERIEYTKDHLEQVLISIKQDRVNVIGYTAWALMDNYEWTNGYTVNFGLYNVDFASPGRERTPRDSARFFAKVVRANSLDVATVPDVITY